MSKERPAIDPDNLSADTPRDVETLKYNELEPLFENQIAEELEHQRAIIEGAIGKIEVAVCKISNNTEPGLAFVRMAAMFKILDEYGVYDKYMSDENREAGSGRQDQWSFEFRRPDSTGKFRVAYVLETANREQTYTQKLLYTAR